jgi:hypothetical protein
MLGGEQWERNRGGAKAITSLSRGKEKRETTYLGERGGDGWIEEEDLERRRLESAGCDEEGYCMAVSCDREREQQQQQPRETSN